MSNENLAYLSSDQALADLRYFICNINDKHGFLSSTKWVAFGSFYGGTLAAWLRKKYPNLIHMAVVTNPLIAKIDYHGRYIMIIVKKYLLNNHIGIFIYTHIIT